MATVHATLNSSWLDTAEYDTETNILTVTATSGQDYTFTNVPSDVFEGLRDAPSAGDYFHKKIKGRY